MPKKNYLLSIFAASFFLIGTFLFTKSFYQPVPNNTSQKSLGQAVTPPQINGQSTTSAVPDRQSVKVVRVVDGDTIEIEGGQKIRYIGINTPETVHPTKPVECFGHEASDANRKLVEGKTVKLEKDVSETDKYGRLLRYVYLKSDQAGQADVFVNDYLVRQGYAQVDTFPPDVKYQQQFLDAQKEALENNRGLWASCRK